MGQRKAKYTSRRLGDNRFVRQQCLHNDYFLNEWWRLRASDDGFRRDHVDSYTAY